MPSLEEKVDRWVARQLGTWNQEKVGERKVIQDPVHGLHYFQPHEIEVINSPIVQRLREISQVGLARWLYPGACHTRFDHSLGMTIMVKEYTDALLESNELEDVISKESINNLRMTAILHDVGHMPFSHAGENFIDEWSSEIELARYSQRSKFGQAKVHEILSYMIVTSKTFVDLTNKLNKRYNVNLDPQMMGNLIVGYSDDPTNDYWMVDIINGYFDADKMDYMKRDSHFAGIKLDLDFERIMNGFRINTATTGLRRLVPRYATLRNLEQFMFNKLLMYSSVYHHHVVRASDRLFDATLEWIFNERMKVRGNALGSVVDLLDFTDSDFFATNSDNDPIVNHYVERMKRRENFRRAGIVSLATIEPSTRKYSGEFTKLVTRPPQLRKFRRVLAAKAGLEEENHHDVWVDLPPNPTLQELDKLELEVSTGKTVKYEDISPGVHNRLLAYAEATWQAYAFANQGFEKKIFDSLSGLLEDAFGIKLNENARVLSKIK